MALLWIFGDAIVVESSLDFFRFFGEFNGSLYRFNIGRLNSIFYGVLHMNYADGLKKLYFSQGNLSISNDFSLF